MLSVDDQRRRIALGLKQLAEDPWETSIPDKYQPGAIVTGTVTKITNFGVFVELETELEGLLHISELADHKVESPEDVVSLGEELEVRILRVDTAGRKIGLSRKLDEEITPEMLETSGAAASATGTPLRPELKGGTGGGSGPLFALGGPDTEEPSEPEAEAEASEAEPATEAEDAAVATDVADESTADVEDSPAADDADEPTAEADELTAEADEEAVETPTEEAAADEAAGDDAEAAPEDESKEDADG